MRRTLENYLVELDYSKTYLIENEILKWSTPSEELLLAFLEGYKNEDFHLFEEIHETMVLAIKRRGRLEELVNQMPLPTDVQSAEFKDVKWAVSEEDLIQRLSRIRALQISSAEKLNQETKQQFLQRIAKYRSTSRRRDHWPHGKRSVAHHSFLRP